MYRAWARRAKELGISATDETALLAMRFEVYFFTGRTLVFEGAEADQVAAGGGQDWTRWLDEKHDCTYKLDNVEFVQFASQIAKLPRLREKFNSIQRSYARNGSIVIEGRDIGTVVVPDAEWKFYIDADEEVRAKRVLKMLPESERGKMTLNQALDRIREIDHADRTREIAPLRKAEDAVLYNNSNCTVEEDVEHLFTLINAGKGSEIKL